MAKEILGDACAYIAPFNRGDKARYIKLGIALKDGDRISLKIDTLPLPGCGWEGWINVFPKREDLGPVPTFAGPATPSNVKPLVKPGASGFDDMDDDIPF